MNENITPKVGQILYDEKLNEDGTIKSASLLYIDEEPNPEEGKWLVTWIAQMQNYNGKGMKVYTDAVAGGMGKGMVTRIAIDEDIMSFVNAIKDSENPQEQIQNKIILCCCLGKKKD